MAVRKMTFSLPEELATRFLRQVPSRSRSRYLASVLGKSLDAEDEALVHSCKLANQDPEVRSIEREMDRLEDPIEEPWNDAAPK